MPDDGFRPHALTFVPMPSHAPNIGLVTDRYHFAPQSHYNHKNNASALEPNTSTFKPLLHESVLGHVAGVVTRSY